MPRKTLSHTYGRRFLEIRDGHRPGEPDDFSLLHKGDIHKPVPGTEVLKEDDDGNLYKSCYTQWCGFGGEFGSCWANGKIVCN